MVACSKLLNSSEGDLTRDLKKHRVYAVQVYLGEGYFGQRGTA